MLNMMFKSMAEQDRASIVICDTEHKIIYMNKAACRNYSKYGGDKLVGNSLFNCHNERSCEIIKKVVAWFEESSSNNMIYTFHNDKENKDVYMVALRDDNNKLIGYYEKHEYRNPETAEFYNFNESLV